MGYTDSHLLKRQKMFWVKVAIGDCDQCWLWQAAIFKKDGYGVWFNKRAHRVAFFLTHGRWPQPQCLHICDNRLCCNPNHLFEGTHQDNMNDGKLKERFASGLRNAKAWLSNEMALRIAQEYQAGRITQTQLAQKYNIGQGRVSEIVRAKGRWASVIGGVR